MSILEQLPESDRRSELMQKIKEEFSTVREIERRFIFNLVAEEIVGKNARLGPETRQLLYIHLDNALEGVKDSDAFSVGNLLIKLCDAAFTAGGSDRELLSKLNSAAYGFLKNTELHQGFYS